MHGFVIDCLLNASSTITSSYSLAAVTFNFHNEAESVGLKNNKTNSRQRNDTLHLQWRVQGVVELMKHLLSMSG